MSDVNPSYKISYVYNDPCRAGPFKGKTIESSSYAKGDQIGAVFGRATVTSCSKIKQVQS